MLEVEIQSTVRRMGSSFLVIVAIILLAVHSHAASGTLTVSGTPWNAIDYTATVNTDNSGVASFSTNATGSSGNYFMLLPYVDTSLTSYYYDSYQNRAWTTYFMVQ